MFEITFETKNATVVKTAKNAKEVRRLVYLYSKGTQRENENTISEILSKKESEELEKFIKPKKEKNEHL